MDAISADPSLPGGRQVIAFDRPPFGLTQRPLHWDSATWDPYTCEGGARLAAGLLEALGVRSAVVVGHSMGAVVAMELLKMCVSALCLRTHPGTICLPGCRPCRVAADTTLLRS